MTTRHKTILDSFAQLAVRRGMDAWGRSTRPAAEISRWCWPRPRRARARARYTEREAMGPCCSTARTSGAMLDVDHVELPAMVVDNRLLERDALAALTRRQQPGRTWRHGYEMSGVDPRIIARAARERDYRVREGASGSGATPRNRR